MTYLPKIHIFILVSLICLVFLGRSDCLANNIISLEQELSIAQLKSEQMSQAEQRIREGLIFLRREHFLKALESFERALTTYKKLEAHTNIAETYNNLGDVYLKKGSYKGALNHYNHALDIYSENDDQIGIAETLNYRGQVYILQGLYKKSLADFEQSLAIYDDLQDYLGQARTLNLFGKVLRLQGNYSTALKNHKNALDIYSESENQIGAAETFNEIGNIYLNLGNYSKANSKYNKSLSIFDDLNHLSGQSVTFINIGKVYIKQNKNEEALRAFDQANSLALEIGDKLNQGFATNQTGLALLNKDLPFQALENFDKSLSFFQEIGYPRGEAFVLNNIGLLLATHSQNMQKRDGIEQAFNHYTESFRIFSALEEREGKGIVLNNLGLLFDKQDQPRLAIIFLKQSVNLREQIRKDLKGLPQQEQQSYTDSVADSYRHLADLLLQQDRVLEAQTVLDLLKVQELDDYLRGVRGTGKQLDFLQPELQILARYKESQTSAIELIQELDALTKLAQSDKLTAKQKQRRLKLIKLSGALKSQFTDFLHQPQIKQLLTQLSRDTTRESINLRNLASYQDNLLKVKGALLSPLILDDRLELVLTMPTPNTPPLRRTVKVQRTELNQTIVEYRQALQNPNVDARPLAQKLYTWLVKPIEADLQKASIKNILYAPDGQLRYIPLAALHDGQQWLTQSYQVINITTTSFTDFDTTPQTNPRILAGALADNKIQRTVTAGQKTQKFSGLPFAGVEVKTLIAARPNTTALLDRDLTLDRALAEMGLHQIIHFATHAAFVPSDPGASFIVFGEGENPTLRDIANWPLSNVDLVILSACETAVGGKLGNGAEVLGLGYQFQQSGSKAVIASLWQVNDGSTQQLMKEFYAALQPGTTKAEALRKAQVALITGRQAADGAKQRSSVDLSLGNNSPSSNIESNLSHPYYWAPFILIGNGL